MWVVKEMSHCDSGLGCGTIPWSCISQTFSCGCTPCSLKFPYLGKNTVLVRGRDGGRSVITESSVPGLWNTMQRSSPLPAAVIKQDHKLVEFTLKATVKNSPQTYITEHVNEPPGAIHRVQEAFVELHLDFSIFDLQAADAAEREVDALAGGHGPGHGLHHFPHARLHRVPVKRPFAGHRRVVQLHHGNIACETGRKSLNDFSKDVFIFFSFQFIVSGLFCSWMQKTIREEYSRTCKTAKLAIRKNTSTTNTTSNEQRDFQRFMHSTPQHRTGCLKWSFACYPA